MCSLQGILPVLATPESDVRKGNNGIQSIYVAGTRLSSHARAHARAKTQVGTSCTHSAYALTWADLRSCCAHTADVYADCCGAAEYENGAELTLSFADEDRPDVVGDCFYDTIRAPLFGRNVDIESIIIIGKGDQAEVRCSASSAISRQCYKLLHLRCSSPARTRPTKYGTPPRRTMLRRRSVASPHIRSDSHGTVCLADRLCIL